MQHNHEDRVLGYMPVHTGPQVPASEVYAEHEFGPYPTGPPPAYQHQYTHPYGDTPGNYYQPVAPPVYTHHMQPGGQHEVPGAAPPHKAAGYTLERKERYCGVNTTILTMCLVLVFWPAAVFVPCCCLIDERTVPARAYEGSAPQHGGSGWQGRVNDAYNQMYKYSMDPVNYYQ